MPAGGWSLKMEIGGTCPTATQTCFSNQTGVYNEFNRTGVPGVFSRGEECCPFGSSPRLDCGTYVNNGQPFACCPLGNADCRGDVSDPERKGNEKCANSGWALWQIPDGGFNMFCCLPDQYGYWYKQLGQDAVGQCSTSSVLPEDSEPAVQFNNGDGSVSSEGVQLTELEVPPATPAPTCDVVHYGWSLQVDNEAGCTEGSNLCSYGGSCCPSGLNCGTVIGDSEVPVCCPPGNPDCRGDVEGLWPQLCADSSWALWHVNTNGNHFCCLPGQVGFNIPNDNAAVGFCGSAVPNGTMRSILDYEGDRSTPGSFAKFPCDTSPAPNATLPEIISAILNPPTRLNPPGATIGAGIPLATGIYANGTYPVNPAVATITKPWIATEYICPPGATETLQVIHSLSNGIPVSVTKTVGQPGETGVPSGENRVSTGDDEVVSYITASPSGSGGSSGSQATGTPVPSLFTGGAERLMGVNALMLSAISALVYMI